jgi:hypothetical protein
MTALMDRVRAVLALLGPLGAGTHVLLLRLAGRFGWKAVLVGLAVAVYAADRYRKWIFPALVLFCAAEESEDPDDETDDEPAGEEPTRPDPQDVVDLVRDLIGDDRGTLLTTLRHTLNAADTRAVREVLTAANIRVREGVRTSAGNGPGVHRDDLPPLPQTHESPPVGPLSCTNAANANANNTIRVQSREGMTIITDPADRHRTHTLNKP